MHKSSVLILICAVVVLLAGLLAARSAWNNGEISPADYGGLLALRDVVSPEVYKGKVLPLLQQGKAISRQQLQELHKELGDLRSQTLAAAQKARPSEALAQAWEDAKSGASSLSEDFGRRFSQMMDELTRPQRKPADSSEQGTEL